MQARARRAIATGNLFPQTQQGFGEYEHIQQSQTIAIPPPLRTFDQWSTRFNLAWELDVWGRFRRAIASADADLEALARKINRKYFGGEVEWHSIRWVGNMTKTGQLHQRRPHRWRHPRQ